MLKRFPPTFKKFIRLTAVMTLLCFVTTNIVWADGMGPRALRVPQQFGEVTSSWTPLKGQGASNKGQEKALAHDPGPLPLVILIQDAHQSFEAQHNLSQLIKYLAHEYGVWSVGVEGATKDLDYTALRQFPIRHITKEVGLDYVRQGKFTGAEYAAFTSGRPLKLYGVEDNSLFEENFKQFYRIYQKNSPFQNRIAEIQSQLKDLQTRTYSPSVQTLQKAWEKLQLQPSEGASLIETVIQFSNQAQIDWMAEYPSLAFFVEWIHDYSDLESKKDEVEKEEQALKTTLLHLQPKIKGDILNDVSALVAYAQIQKINLTDYATLVSYSENKKRAQLVNGPQALEELNQLVNRLQLKLARDEAERNLIRVSKEADVLAILVRLEARAEQVKKFEKWLNAGWTWKDWEDKVNLIIGSSKKIASDESIFKDILTFYKTAEKRNAAMIENLLRHARTREESLVKREASDVSRDTFHVLRPLALVAGGFHTQGLSEELKKRGISYVVVTPAITSSNTPLPYLDKMLGRLVPLDPRFTSTLIALLQQVLNREDYQQVVVDLFGSAEHAEALREFFKEGNTLDWNRVMLWAQSYPSLYHAFEKVEKRVREKLKRDPLFWQKLSDQARREILLDMIRPQVGTEKILERARQYSRIVAKNRSSKTKKGQPKVFRKDTSRKNSNGNHHIEVNKKSQQWKKRIGNSKLWMVLGAFISELLLSHGLQVLFPRAEHVMSASAATGVAMAVAVVLFGHLAGKDRPEIIQPGHAQYGRWLYWITQPDKFIGKVRSQLTRSKNPVVLRFCPLSNATSQRENLELLGFQSDQNTIQRMIANHISVGTVESLESIPGRNGIRVTFKPHSVVQSPWVGSPEIFTTIDIVRSAQHPASHFSKNFNESFGSPASLNRDEEKRKVFLGSVCEYLRSEYLQIARDPYYVLESSGSLSSLRTLMASPVFPSQLWAEEQLRQEHEKAVSQPGPNRADGKDLADPETEMSDEAQMLDWMSERVNRIFELDAVRDFCALDSRAFMERLTDTVFSLSKEEVGGPTTSNVKRLEAAKHAAEIIDSTTDFIGDMKNFRDSFSGGKLRTKNRKALKQRFDVLSRLQTNFENLMQVYTYMALHNLSGPMRLEDFAPSMTLYTTLGALQASVQSFMVTHQIMNEPPKGAEKRSEFLNEEIAYRSACLWHREGIVDVARLNRAREGVLQSLNEIREYCRGTHKADYLANLYDYLFQEVSRLEMTLPDDTNEHEITLRAARQYVCFMVSAITLAFLGSQRQSPGAESHEAKLLKAFVRFKRHFRSLSMALGGLVVEYHNDLPEVEDMLHPFEDEIPVQPQYAKQVMIVSLLNIGTFTSAFLDSEIVAVNHEKTQKRSFYDSLREIHSVGQEVEEGRCPSEIAPVSADVERSIEKTFRFLDGVLESFLEDPFVRKLQDKRMFHGLSLKVASRVVDQLTDLNRKKLAQYNAGIAMRGDVFADGEVEKYRSIFSGIDGLIEHLDTDVYDSLDKLPDLSNASKVLGIDLKSCLAFYFRMQRLGKRNVYDELVLLQAHIRRLIAQKHFTPENLNWVMGRFSSLRTYMLFLLPTQAESALPINLDAAYGDDLNPLLIFFAHLSFMYERISFHLNHDPLRTLPGVNTFLNPTGDVDLDRTLNLADGIQPMIPIVQTLQRCFSEMIEASHSIPELERFYKERERECQLLSERMEHAEPSQYRDLIEEADILYQSLSRIYLTTLHQVRWNIEGELKPLILPPAFLEKMEFLMRESDRLTGKSSRPDSRGGRVSSPARGKILGILLYPLSFLEEVLHAFSTIFTRVPVQDVHIGAEESYVEIDQTWMNDNHSSWALAITTFTPVAFWSWLTSYLGVQTFVLASNGSSNLRIVLCALATAWVGSMLVLHLLGMRRPRDPTRPDDLYRVRAILASKLNSSLSDLVPTSNRLYRPSLFGHWGDEEDHAPGDDEHHSSIIIWPRIRTQYQDFQTQTFILHQEQTDGRKFSIQGGSLDEDQTRKLLRQFNRAKYGMFAIPSPITIEITADSGKLGMDFQNRLHMAATSEDFKTLFIHPYFFSDDFSDDKRLRALYDVFVLGGSTGRRSQDEILRDIRSIHSKSTLLPQSLDDLDGKTLVSLSMEGNIPELKGENPLHTWKKVDYRKPRSQQVARQVYYEDGIPRRQVIFADGPTHPKNEVLIYDFSGRVPRMTRFIADDVSTPEKVLTVEEHGTYQNTTTYAPSHTPMDVVFSREKDFKVLSETYFDGQNAATKGGLGAYQGDKLEGLFDVGIKAYGVQPLYSKVNKNGQFVPVDYEALIEKGVIKYETTLPLVYAWDVNDPFNPHNNASYEVKVYSIIRGGTKTYLLRCDVFDELYVDNKIKRFAQEVVFGKAVVQLMERMDIKPDLLHLNEGHVSIAAALIDNRRENPRFSNTAIVYTNHTLVPSGLQPFNIYGDFHLDDYNRAHGTNYSLQDAISRAIYTIGIDDHVARNLFLRGDLIDFCQGAQMLADVMNAVSEEHAIATEQLFIETYGDKFKHKGKVVGILNGSGSVWVNPELREMEENGVKPTQEELYQIHEKGKEQAYREIEKRTGKKLDKKLPTFWAVRRLTEYKAQYPMLRFLVHVITANRDETFTRDDLKRLWKEDDPNLNVESDLVKSVLEGLFVDEKGKPVDVISGLESQLVVGGPLAGGSDVKDHWIPQFRKWSESGRFHNRVVFIEQSDAEMLRMQSMGSDVVITMPRPLEEACGTSDQRAGRNGGVNIAINGAGPAEWMEEFDEATKTGSGFFMGSYTNEVDGKLTPDNKAFDEQGPGDIFKKARIVSRLYYQTPNTWKTLMFNSYSAATREDSPDGKLKGVTQKAMEKRYAKKVYLEALRIRAEKTAARKQEIRAEDERLGASHSGRIYWDSFTEQQFFMIPALIAATIYLAQGLLSTFQAAGPPSWMNAFLIGALVLKSFEQPFLKLHDAVILEKEFKDRANYHQYLKVRFWVFGFITIAATLWFLSSFNASSVFNFIADLPLRLLSAQGAGVVVHALNNTLFAWKASHTVSEKSSPIEMIQPGHPHYLELLSAANTPESFRKALEELHTAYPGTRFALRFQIDYTQTRKVEALTYLGFQSHAAPLQLTSQAVIKIDPPHPNALGRNVVTLTIGNGNEPYRVDLTFSPKLGDRVITQLYRYSALSSQDKQSLLSSLQTRLQQGEIEAFSDLSFSLPSDTERTRVCQVMGLSEEETLAWLCTEQDYEASRKSAPKQNVEKHLEDDRITVSADQVQLARLISRELRFIVEEPVVLNLRQGHAYQTLVREGVYTISEAIRWASDPYAYRPNVHNGDLAAIPFDSLQAIQQRAQQLAGQTNLNPRNFKTQFIRIHDDLITLAQQVHEFSNVMKEKITQFQLAAELHGLSDDYADGFRIYLNFSEALNHYACLVDEAIRLLESGSDLIELHTFSNGKRFEKTHVEPATTLRPEYYRPSSRTMCAQVKGDLSQLSNREQEPFLSLVAEMNHLIDQVGELAIDRDDDDAQRLIALLLCQVQATILFYAANWQVHHQIPELRHSFRTLMIDVDALAALSTPSYVEFVRLKVPEQTWTFVANAVSDDGRVERHVIGTFEHNADVGRVYRIHDDESALTMLRAVQGRWIMNEHRVSETWLAKEAVTEEDGIIKRVWSRAPLSEITDTPAGIFDPTPQVITRPEWLLSDDSPLLLARLTLHERPWRLVAKSRNAEHSYEMLLAPDQDTDQSLTDEQTVSDLIAFHRWSGLVGFASSEIGEGIHYLHDHIYFPEPNLPFFPIEQKTSQILGWADSARSVSVEQLLDYPMTHVVLSGSDDQKIAKQLVKVTHELIERKIPYQVIFSPVRIIILFENPNRQVWHDAEQRYLGGYRVTRLSLAGVFSYPRDVVENLTPEKCYKLWSEIGVSSAVSGEILARAFPVLISPTTSPATYLFNSSWIASVGAATLTFFQTAYPETLQKNPGILIAILTGVILLYWLPLWIRRHNEKKKPQQKMPYMIVQPQEVEPETVKPNILNPTVHAAALLKANQNAFPTLENRLNQLTDKTTPKKVAVIVGDVKMSPEARALLDSYGAISGGNIHILEALRLTGPVAWHKALEITHQASRVVVLSTPQTLTQDRLKYPGAWVIAVDLSEDTHQVFWFSILTAVLTLAKQDRVTLPSDFNVLFLSSDKNPRWLSVNERQLQKLLPAQWKSELEQSRDFENAA